MSLPDMGDRHGKGRANQKSVTTVWIISYYVVTQAIYFYRLMLDDSR